MKFIFMPCLTALLCVVFMLPVCSTVKAAVTIDSTIVTLSTCQNNGSITVYATDAGNSLLYVITSGPVTRSPQINNEFTSLPSGTYMVKVINQFGNSDSVRVVVGGNYHIPNPVPKVIYPVCRNSRNFRLIGNLDSASGAPPFTWQLVAPSPAIAGPQSSDTFHVTLPGTYTIQCTDACGNIQTRFFTFSDTIGSNISPNPYLLNAIPVFTGCDSIREGLNILINGDSTHIVFPITLTISNTHGNVSVYTVAHTLYDTTLLTATSFFFNGIGQLSIATTLPNTSWGDVVNMVVTDGCGDSITSTTTLPAKVISGTGFTSYYSGTCQLLQQADFSYFMLRPNYWTFTDNQSGRVIGQGMDTMPNWYVTNNYFSMDSLIPGRSYTAKAYDFCGDSIITDFVVPVATPVTPYSFTSTLASSCLDSSASELIFSSGFNHPVLKILSGPAGCHSSNAGYAYALNYNYPQSFNNISSPFPLTNLGAGTYTYSIADVCGNSVAGQFTIPPDSLTVFSHSLSVIKGCVGENALVCRFGGWSFSNYDVAGVSYTISDLASGQQIVSSNNHSAAFTDTVLNLYSGTYVLSAQHYTNGYSLNNEFSCATNNDTITIPPYQNPAISTLFAEPCEGSFYLVALADSSTGVPPYTYQVINGPQTFAAQNDDKFLISQPGTYTIRIYDACGNSGLKDMGIDSLPGGLSVRYNRRDSCFHAFVNGNEYFTNTVISDTLKNFLGCDSLVRFDSIFILGTTDSVPLLAGNDTFCNGRQGLIVPPQNYATYVWNDGTTGVSNTVSLPGIYALTVTDIAGCTLSASTNVSFIDSPYITGWLPQLAVCAFNPVFIDLKASTTIASYNWNTPDGYQNSLSRPIADTGLYVFSIANTCGTSTYYMTVTAKDCNEHFYIPNAFTPNGDGVNDLFRAYFTFPLQYFSFRIFDRWGEIVFETNNENDGWTGFYKGSLLPQGVYVYDMQVVYLGGIHDKAKGSFTLLR